MLTHSAFQLRLLHAARGEPPAAPPASDPVVPLPSVTVQLPVFNERFVVEGLLDHVAALRYPRHLIEVQVLDDSTDETTELVAEWIESFRAGTGDALEVSHVRRCSRDGFKAGALAAGLRRARGELVAIFDADFRPEPDFLERVVPHFADPAVAVVQGRWGHANRDESALTRVSALLLDVHFDVEQVGRAALGCFLNFNGSAGVWRAEAIRGCGGWRADTLTEDLDLSYRAQLRGWRIRYDGTLVVPAQLPGSMRALRAQQQRWVKGSAENARQLVPRLLRARQPLPVRVHACAHLVEGCAYVALMLLAILAAPVGLMIARGLAPAWLALHPGVLLSFAALAPVYRFPQVRQRPARMACFAADYVGFMVLAMGMAPGNAVAVLRGLAGRRTAFERTPKRGERPGGYRQPRRAALNGAEVLLLAVSTGGLALAVTAGAVLLTWPIGILVLAHAGVLVADLCTVDGAIGGRRHDRPLSDI